MLASVAVNRFTTPFGSMMSRLPSGVESVLRKVSIADTQRPPLDTIDLPLLGGHQRLNAAVAIATVDALQPRLPVSEKAIRAGLSSVRWLGRLQEIKMPGGQTVLLDGAHNPAGIESLRSALDKHFPGRRPAIIFGVMGDKDWPAMCKILAPLAARMALTPVGSQRTASPQELVAACRHANPEADIFTSANLSEAIRRTAADAFVVVTGSLHFIGEAMEQLNLMPEPPTSERGLNEWNQPACGRAPRTGSSAKTVE